MLNLKEALDRASFFCYNTYRNKNTRKKGNNMIKEFCIGRKHKKLVDFDIYVYGCTVETCDDGKTVKYNLIWPHQRMLFIR